MAVMNIELGKKIFFKCYGNAFGIQREYGKEYKKCKIPRKYEIEWLDEIKNQLYEAINNSSGNKRYSNFIKLCDIISLNAAIELTCKFLETNLDYFERLLYTEYLKLLNKKVNIESFSGKKYEGIIVGYVPAQDNDPEIEEISIKNDADNKVYSLFENEVKIIKILEK